METMPKKLHDFFFGQFLFAALLYVGPTFAQNGPASLNLSGALYNPDGSPIAQTNVKFQVELYANGCLFYTENFGTQDLSHTQGAFSLQLGSGTIVNKYETSSNYDTKLFVNDGSTVGAPTCTPSVTLSPGLNRTVRVYYDLGSGAVAMTPDIPVTNAPYAMVADTLQGLTPANLIQVQSDASNQLTQSNVANVFSATNYPILQSLLAGTDNKFMSATPTSTVDFNDQRLTNIAAPTVASDAVTKSYADADLGGHTINLTGIGTGMGQGKTLTWDQSSGTWVATNVGSVTSVTSGNGLIGSIITNTGTLAVDAGTSANQIIQLNALAQIPGVDQQKYS